MKKNLITFLGLVLLIGMLAIAYAGQVGDRVVFSGGTNCIGRWTNTFQYSALKLRMVRVSKSLTATNVVTFTRITGDDTNNVFTNTIGAVTCASGAGVQATLTADILKYGDIVVATGIDAATGATSNTFKPWLEFDVQQH
jgi:hypothetical protein